MTLSIGLWAVMIFNFQGGLVLKINKGDLNKKSAFSLIEIILVVILLTVIAGLTAVNFTKTLKKFQLKKTAEDLVYLMRYAQSRAVMKNRPVQLIISEDQLEYWITQQPDEDSPDGQESDRISSRMGKNHSVPDALMLESEEQKIVFYPDGQIDRLKLKLCSEFLHCYTISTKEQRASVVYYESNEN